MDYTPKELQEILENIVVVQDHHTVLIKRIEENIVLGRRAVVVVEANQQLMRDRVQSLEAQATELNNTNSVLLVNDDATKEIIIDKQNKRIEVFEANIARIMEELGLPPAV
jgi:hypothetical protein